MASHTLTPSAPAATPDVGALALLLRGASDADLADVAGDDDADLAYAAYLELDRRGTRRAAGRRFAVIIDAVMGAVVMDIAAIAAAAAIENTEPAGA